ncbi:hypothetical protein A5662_20245 [Mycobacteriaceae bacterium 1482268.1]|nr:hypothetical protein A5662_20245 [Mycobacteriaceae bacterium 1482268.1]
MNSYYGPQAPQHRYYGPPHAYYAPAPQPQYAPVPAAPQNSGSGIKMAAGALALLAVGIGAFAIVFGMKQSNVETTSAQSAPSTVFNIPSEISLPSLGGSTSTAPVVVNNPAPRVITVPGQAPVQQAPVQQAPVAQGQPDNSINTDRQAKIEEQKRLEEQKKLDEQKAKDDATKKEAETKAANAQKAKDLRANAATLRQQAQQIRIDATLQLPGTPARLDMENQAAQLEASAAQMEAEAASLGG